MIKTWQGYRVYIVERAITSTVFIWTSNQLPWRLRSYFVARSRKLPIRLHKRTFRRTVGSVPRPKYGLRACSRKKLCKMFLRHDWQVKCGAYREVRWPKLALWFDFVDVRNYQVYHCHLDSAIWNWQYTKRKKQRLRRTYWMRGCRAYDTRTVGYVHVSRGTSLKGHYSARSKSVTEPHYTFHQTNNPMADWRYIYTKQVL